MNKKLTFGKAYISKLMGIIFCIIAVVGTVALLWANIYFGGQMKLIDKYYTALERDDFEGYKACFAKYTNIDEEEFEDDKAEITILQNNEKIRAKASFTKREKYNQYIHIVYYDLTIYNDDESEEKNSLWLSMERENGKWVIT